MPRGTLSHGAMLGNHGSGPGFPQQSVTPGFARLERNTASRREAAVQGAGGPHLLRFTGAVTCGGGDTAVVLAAVRVPSVEPEILRCISGDRGQRQESCRSNILGHPLNGRSVRPPDWQAARADNLTNEYNRARRPAIGRPGSNCVWVTRPFWRPWVLRNRPNRGARIASEASRPAQRAHAYSR